MRVRLTPKASANRVAGTVTGPDGGVQLKAAVTAVPENGKANAQLIKLLAKAWKVPKSSLSVVAGATERNKVLFLAGDPEDLLPRLEHWMEANHGG